MKRRRTKTDRPQRSSEHDAESDPDRRSPDGVQPGAVAAVRDRAATDSCRFTLLVPASPRGLHRFVDPEDHGRPEALRAIDAARPALEAAAGSLITARVGSHDPLAAVQDAINLGNFDAVIISTLPARVSRGLHLDLADKVTALGLPVTQVADAPTVAALAA
jgi:GABA permease